MQHTPRTLNTALHRVLERHSLLSPPAALQALQPAQAQLVPAEPPELRAAREAMRRVDAGAADAARLREEELKGEAERGVSTEEQDRGERPGCSKAVAIGDGR